MAFAYPWTLALLVIPLALIVLGWQRGGHKVALPFDHQSNDRGRSLYILLQLARMLPKLLLAVAILILAGPRKFSQPKQLRELTNIQFCIDVSGSMTASFGEGDRYDAAMKAMNEFVAVRKGDAFALTIFGNNFLHWVPLTSDPSAFKCAPPFLAPDKLPDGFGGTEIGKALRACEKVLVNREEGDRMILLISDGQSGDLSGGNDEKIAELLKSSGITMFAIHIGQGEVPEEVDFIATSTGGAAFPAGDEASLKFVFERIDSMKKAKLKRVNPDPVDDYFPYLVAALSLLGVHLLCLFGIRYNPW